MEGFPTKLATAPYGLSDCWEYQGPKMRAGKDMRYGYPVINGKHKLLHRHIWELANKAKIPKGRVVRHRCDNSICINPEHLEIGSQRDNVMDMVERGNHGHSRVSAEACRRGHPRSPENTQEYMRFRDGKWWLHRRCRVCRRK